MGVALGTFLNDYVFPLVGLGLLTAGVWCSWELWRPWTRNRASMPPLAARVAALILGGVCGWMLANLTHPLDPQHVTLGWPMPVMTLTRDSGRWLELGAASVPCVLLDLAIGAGMVNALLRFCWKLRPRRRPRKRAGFFDAWQAPRVRTALRPFPQPPARRRPRPEYFQANQSTSRA
jgi:hypothetical protein